MEKKFISILVCLTLVITAFALAPFNVSAATEEEIEDSIALGLSWLASQQNIDGSWGSYYYISTTGLAVLKFIDYVKEVPDIDSWTDPGYVYHDVVVDGLNFLFSEGYYVDITVQTYGDPDILDNEKGIRFTGFDDYETSIALMAIGATMTPSLVVTVGGDLNGLTYADVVQDIVDYLSYEQRESVNARGGWGYEGDPNWADNSVSGYAVLGLGYAQVFGATIPQFVKDELEIWISLIQAPDGHSYYRPPAVWPTPYSDLLLRTGNLLYEMALVDWPVDDPQVQLALNFIENNWALGGNSYQRAFCLMKGLEVYGIEDEISVGISGNWFDELSTYIVSTQNPDGSWPNDPHDGDYPYSMTASWALLSLERTVAIPFIEVYVDIKPGSCPNPINLGSKGVIPVAICTSADDFFDASTIDPSTIILTREGYEDVGVSPIRWSYEDIATPYMGDDECGCHDLNGDGYIDLSLKFKTQEVINALNLSEEMGNTIPLIITGNLKEEFDGLQIRGQDCVWIHAKKLITFLQHFPLLKLLLSYLQIHLG